MGQGSILVKNDEKIKVLRMSLPIVKSLSGLQESIIQPIQRPPTQFPLKQKNGRIVLNLPIFPFPLFGVPWAAVIGIYLTRRFQAYYCISLLIIGGLSLLLSPELQFFLGQTPIGSTWGNRGDGGKDFERCSTLSAPAWPLAWPGPQDGLRQGRLRLKWAKGRFWSKIYEKVKVCRMGLPILESLS